MKNIDFIICLGCETFPDLDLAKNIAPVFYLRTMAQSVPGGQTLGKNWPHQFAVFHLLSPINTCLLLTPFIPYWPFFLS